MAKQAQKQAPRKQAPPEQKPTISNDNHDENIGQRGEATRQGGTKIHGDDLEGVIPTTPMEVERQNERQDQGVMAEFGDHCAALPGLFSVA